METKNAQLVEIHVGGDMFQSERGDGNINTYIRIWFVEGSPVDVVFISKAKGFDLHPSTHESRREVIFDRDGNFTNMEDGIKRAREIHAEFVDYIKTEIEKTTRGGAS